METIPSHTTSELTWDGRPRKTKLRPELRGLTGKAYRSAYMRLFRIRRTADAINKDHGLTKHGMSGTKEHRTWCNIINRCHNPKDARFIYYGARGISVCAKWRGNFLSFYEDMGKAPTSQHSIERKDNNGNYERENCKWATWEEQCSNKRTSVFITWKGVTKCVSDWEKSIGYHNLHKRLKLGWSIERAFSQPVQGREKHKQKVNL